MLNAGKKVAMLVGAGALQATDEVIAVAELLGAGVAKALLGKAAVPDDLPFVTGSIGLLGTRPSWDMMMGCDTLLMVGSGFPYSEFLPKEGQARGVQIDIDGRMLGLRYPMEINLVGDSAATLRALLPLLESKPDRCWRDGIEKNVARMVAGARRPRHERGGPDQPAARLLGAVAAAAGQLHHHLRLRLARELVCPRPEDPARHDVLAVGRPGDDGPGRALCDGGEVRPSRPAGRSRWSATARCR